ncbi:hypothetical protein SAMN05444162_3016 [Paenibacillaceae bacterium GAS479]|nr:hypothetical protein SAMN05444162_3016 [Paenibacillaceae bacterium GAS479]
MPVIVDWITRHWVSLSVSAALLAACLFVFVNRKSLFYKE